MDQLIAVFVELMKTKPDAVIGLGFFSLCLCGFGLFLLSEKMIQFFQNYLITKVKLKAIELEVSASKSKSLALHAEALQTNLEQMKLMMEMMSELKKNLMVGVNANSAGEESATAESATSRSSSAQGASTESGAARNIFDQGLLDAMREGKSNPE